MAEYNPFSTQGMQQGQFGINQPQVNVPGLEGYAQSRALNQAMRNWQLQNLFNEQVQQANQNTLGEFSQNAPVRQQARELQMQYAPLQREQEFTQKNIANQMESAKLPGVEAESRGKVTKEEVDRLERNTEMITQVLPSFQGPAATAEFSKWAESVNMKQSSPVRKYLESSPTSEEFQRRGQLVLQQAGRNAAQRRKEYELLMETGSRERIADIQTSAQLEASREKAEATRATKATSDKLEQDIVKLRRELSTAIRGKAPQEEVAAIRDELQYATQLWLAHRSAGAQLVPMMPGIEFGRPPAAAPAPPGSTPVPGTTQGGLPPGVTVRRKQ